MITKNQIKYYASLQKKKSREEEGVFLIEGHRSVLELFQSRLELKAVIATDAWLSQNEHLLPKSTDCIIAPQVDLERISSLQTPPQVIACAALPRLGQLPIPSGRLILALDTVQDPGNMGTIIRTADWFGIDSIVCSHESADAFGPKVVQSTMGALGRVAVYYTNLDEYLAEVRTAGFSVYGTLLSGANMYEQKLSQEGVILLGNEGNGISEPLMKHINCGIFIPPFPAGADNVESLNVGVAAAIVCAEFRRRS